MKANNLTKDARSETQTYCWRLNSFTCFCEIIYNFGILREKLIIELNSSTDNNESLQKTLLLHEGSF
jgi:hypothetical protein